jgi:hypothetical protein
VKPHGGARLVKLSREPHAHTLNIMSVYPHITPDIFVVVLRSRSAQLRKKSEREKEYK